MITNIELQMRVTMTIVSGKTLTGVVKETGVTDKGEELVGIALDDGTKMVMLKRSALAKLSEVPG